MYGPSLSKYLTFRDATTGFPETEMTSEKRLQKFHTDERSG